LEGEGGEAALFLSRESETDMVQRTVEIHCYNCGGFIGDPEATAHRLLGTVLHSARAASPKSALCTCHPPVVYDAAGAGEGMIGAAIPVRSET
jgi:hypothetical protein